MKSLRQTWQDIRYSLWFVPTVMVAFAIALAVAAVEFDSSIGSQVLSRWPRVFGASADGARAMLQTVASAMVNVAALTFSITVLVLSMGASQYTPRMIRTFMGNRATQSVLGAFVGIFAYCLIVLRSIRGGEDSFIPSISVTIAAGLALLGIGLLVYFIHHIASSIQASAIVASITEDTTRVIDTVFRDPNRDDSRTHDAPPGNDDWVALSSGRTGYLRSVDLDGLAQIAHAHDVIVRMDATIGSFVAESTPLLSLNRHPDEQMARALRRPFTFGHYRTVEQDIGMGIRQLADIALRAMSPAVNDTTTALLAIDFLTAILLRMAPRRLRPEDRYCQGFLRVIAAGSDFNDFLDEAFGGIRENAGGNTAIHLRLLQALGTLGGATVSSPQRRSRIAREIEMVCEYARNALRMPDQLGKVEHARVRALRELAKPAAVRDQSQTDRPGGRSGTGSER